MNAPVTKQELEQMYGIDNPRRVHDEIVETLTKTVRTVSSAKLGLPYVKHGNGTMRIAMFPLAEVVTDYGAAPKPLAALMAIIEKSDCPLVAKWREAMAEHFADVNAEEVDEVLQ